MNDHTEGGKYRMLKKGEIIEAGDEMKGNFGQWVPVHLAALGAGLLEVNVGRFRRLVTQEYRMLKHREIIISGDERKNKEGQWVPVGRPALGTGLHEMNVGRFRRPVAQEYLMLKKGEVRQEGDEYLSKDGTWHPTKHPGSYVRSVGRIRRPVTQEPTVTGPDSAANDGVTEASTPARPQLPFANRDEAVNCFVREVFGAEPVYADQSVANKIKQALIEEDVALRDVLRDMIEITAKWECPGGFVEPVTEQTKEVEASPDLLRRVIKEIRHHLKAGAKIKAEDPSHVLEVTGENDIYGGLFVEYPKEDEPWMPKPPQNLREDIQRAINCRSAENGSDTPDWILAEYLIGCLENFDKAVQAREVWYGRGSTPVPDDEIPVSVANEPDLGEWLGHVAVSTLESHACGAPLGLPPLPPVPEGYDRWEYRGTGWGSDSARYIFTEHGNSRWEDSIGVNRAKGYKEFHYVEALKDAKPTRDHEEIIGVIDVHGRFSQSAVLAAEWDECYPNDAPHRDVTLIEKLT